MNLLTQPLSCYRYHCLDRKELKQYLFILA